MLGSTKLKTISNIPIMPMKPNTYIEMENEKPDDEFTIVQGETWSQIVVFVACLNTSSDICLKRVIYC